LHLQSDLCRYGREEDLKKLSRCSTKILRERLGNLEHLAYAARSIFSMIWLLLREKPRELISAGKINF
jgi:hypothetical protein